MLVSVNGFQVDLQGEISGPFMNSSFLRNRSVITKGHATICADHESIGNVQINLDTLNGICNLEMNPMTMLMHPNASNAFACHSSMQEPLIDNL